MEDCSLDYIPPHLHSDNRPIINEFNIGDYLYHRASPDVIENPYKRVSITELSHNLGGNPKNPLSSAEDVLFSIKSEEAFEKYEGKAICTLRIISLTTDRQYNKEFFQEKNGKKARATIKLLHDPKPCMYPHCLFRIWLNGTKVTYDNYNQTLKKWNIIRTKLKQELASMIIQKVVSQE